jgi:hypothetical protein
MHLDHARTVLGLSAGRPLVVGRTRLALLWRIRMPQEVVQSLGASASAVERFGLVNGITLPLSHTVYRFRSGGQCGPWRWPGPSFTVEDGFVRPRPPSRINWPVAALRDACRDGRLDFPGTFTPLNPAAAFRAFLRSLSRRTWVVYAKPPFGSPAHVLH